MAILEEDPESVRELNALLADELSACQTYGQAINKVSDPLIKTDLIRCQESHQQRVLALRERVRDLGAEPVEDAGVWGAVVKLLEGGAAIFGEKATISVLEEEEDRGLRDYRGKMEKLDLGSQALVAQSLLPAQEHTHLIMSELKRMMH